MIRNIFILLLFQFACGMYGWPQEEFTVDIVVDRNGRGDYRTVQEAIESVRAFNPGGNVVVLIRDGVYKEKIEIPSFICNVTFVGESKENTIITWDDHANINKMGTFRTYTLLVRGNDITFENLTIENSSLPLGQAVALHSEGDRVIVRGCRILGNQDTVYTGKEAARMYFEDCYIEGTTDFLFGPSTCWFEKCVLHCKRNSYITAASTPQHIAFGYVFNACRITLAEGIDRVFLGRPWRPYAMTLFMNCEIPEGIKPEGWHNWGKEENEKTARYMEYNNSGKGADTSQRVSWMTLLNKSQAEKYTVKNVMKGADGWNPVAD